MRLQSGSALESEFRLWRERLRPSGATGMILETLLVVGILVLGVRTFLIHPMWVPTGSMEPSFRGPAIESIKGGAVLQTSGLWTRLHRFVFYGEREVRSEAWESGRLQLVDAAPQRLGPFRLWQRYSIGDVVHRVWFPPPQLWLHAGLKDGAVFKAGAELIHLRVRSGDWMWVDRLSINFRQPRRGDAVVFRASSIDARPRAPFYLKRLVGFAGEQISIGDDGKLRAEGVVPETLRGEGVPFYVNGTVALANGYASVAPRLPTEDSFFTVRDRRVFVLGDHSALSLDSRVWGDVPEEAIVSRQAWVVWPFFRSGFEGPRSLGRKVRFRLDEQEEVGVRIADKALDGNRAERP